MKIKVYIENPVRDGAYITSRKQAEKYVARGRAKFVPPPRNFTLAIRFIERDGRDVLEAHLTRRDQERFYDRACSSGQLDRKRMRKIPFAGLNHEKYVRLIS